LSHSPSLITGPEAPRLKASEREIELKFLLRDADFKAAQKWEILGPKTPRGRWLHSVYFDSKAGDLSRQSCILRVRTVNGRHLQTFKYSGTFAGGLFERGEVEVALASQLPDPALFGDELGNWIATLTQGEALVPAYETHIKRTAYPIQRGASTIELAFDSGTIQANGAQEPVCEVELELKSGDPAALFQLGLEFAAAFPTHIGVSSKAERAQRLVSAQPPAIVRAHAPLAGAPSVDEAIGRCLSSCLSHFLGNWPAFYAGDRVKAVHQMRVSMRRLRALASLFQRSFASPEWPQIRTAAKNIAQTMGEARNWDVFIDMVKDGPARAFPLEPSLESLLAQAGTRREAGYLATKDLLQASETTQFVLSLQVFIARRGWRNALSGEVLPWLSTPAYEFGRSNLGRLHHRMVKRAKKFTSLSSHQRHEIRKDLKKLRYAAEMFRDLFEKPGQIDAYIKIIAKLQDRLGVNNDLAVAQEQVSHLPAKDDLDASRAMGIIMGWCARGMAMDDEAVQKTWKKFQAIKLFGKA
jgi:triphosphatase